MDGEVSLFPITGWEASPVTTHDAVVVRFQYLSSPRQPENAPHTSPGLVLTRAQTADLIHILQKQLARLEMPDAGGGEGQVRH
jgi:biofilm regulator BssS